MPSAVTDTLAIVGLNKCDGDFSKKEKVVKQDSIEEIISSEELLSRTRQLGQRITHDYQRTELIVVCVLRGAVIFFSDLVRSIELDLRLDFISVSSYGSATKSTGEVRLVKDLEGSVRGRHLLLVEDIVDTGLTLDYLTKVLRSRQPASLEVCSLLSKPSRRETEVEVKYLGFEIPDRFVVGYGLDFDQRYRNLPYIGALPHGA